MNELIKSYQTVATMRVLHGWNKEETIKSLAFHLKEETDKDIYSEDEKNEMRKLYVMESMKLN